MIKYVFKMLQSTIMTNYSVFMKNWDIVSHQFRISEDNWFIKNIQHYITRDPELMNFIVVVNNLTVEELEKVLGVTMPKYLDGLKSLMKKLDQEDYHHSPRPRE